MTIVKVSVLKLEYKGKNTAALTKGWHYIAVVIEGFVEDRSEVRLEFQNGESVKITYDSFVFFAQDWNIIGEFEFEECFLPAKSE